MVSKANGHNGFTDVAFFWGGCGGRGGRGEGGGRGGIFI